MSKPIPPIAANDDLLASPPAVDDDVAAREVLRKKLADAQTPGYQVEFDPDEAERAGAFSEEALTEHDAAASTDDLVEVDGSLEPAFVTDPAPLEPPAFVNTTSARKLFDLRPGETVAQAAARTAAEG